MPSAMSERRTVKTQATNAPGLTASGVLQRKCASCGNHTMAGGKCEECEKKGGLLQRKSNGHSESFEVPPIVHEVLNSPGQHLDAPTRAFMEPRFDHDFSRVRVHTTAPHLSYAKLTVGQTGDRYEQEADQMAEMVMRTPSPTTPSGAVSRRVYDFSQVRVHTDARAARSARAVNALAYTVGRDVVFGAGQYAPGTSEGRMLIAHELTHVAQQSANDGTSGNKMRVQRALLPCTNRKTLNVYAVSLPGATRNPSGDITTANSALCQCGLSLNLAGGQSWQTNLLDKLAPNNVLNEYSSPGSPTDEEKEMLAYQPGGSAIHLYYVPSLSAGSEAEAFWTSGFPTVNNGVAISDSAPACAVAHEIGHVLLDDGGHHPNRDNLMARGAINTCAGELEQTQCDKMP